MAGPTLSPTRLQMRQQNGLTIALTFSTRLKDESHRLVSAIGTTGTSMPSRWTFSSIFKMPPLKGCSVPSLVMRPSGKSAFKILLAAMMRPARGPAAQLDQRVHWHLVQAGKQVDQRQVQPHVPVRGPRIEVLRLITSDGGKPREAK